MKRIIAAWIEQILEFDTNQEYLEYLDELNKKHQEYQEMKHELYNSGVIKIRIRKQYNKNNFPDPQKEGGDK